MLLHVVVFVCLSNNVWECVVVLFNVVVSVCLSILCYLLRVCSMLVCLFAQAGFCIGFWLVCQCSCDSLFALAFV